MENIETRHPTTEAGSLGHKLLPCDIASLQAFFFNGLTESYGIPSSFHNDSVLQSSVISAQPLLGQERQDLIFGESQQSRVDDTDSVDNGYYVYCTQCCFFHSIEYCPSNLSRDYIEPDGLQATINRSPLHHKPPSTEIQRESPPLSPTWATFETQDVGDRAIDLPSQSSPELPSEGTLSHAVWDDTPTPEEEFRPLPSSQTCSLSVSASPPASSATTPTKEPPTAYQKREMSPGDSNATSIHEACKMAWSPPRAPANPINLPARLILTPHHISPTPKHPYRGLDQYDEDGFEYESDSQSELSEYEEHRPPGRSVKRARKSRPSQLPERRKKTYPCSSSPPCDKTFTKRSDANRHRDESCKNTQRLEAAFHICERCSKSLSRADALKRHLKTCRNNKNRQKKVNKARD